MDEKIRDPTKCLRSPTLWLALSSLCVLDSDHVERLSSGQWTSADGQPPPPRVSQANSGPQYALNRFEKVLHVSILLNPFFFIAYL